MLPVDRAVDPGHVLAAGCSTAFVLAVVLRRTGATTVQATAALCLVALSCALLCRAAAALGCAAVAWASLTGFDVNTLGTLTFARPDLARLTLVFASATFGLAGRSTSERGRRTGAPYGAACRGASVPAPRASRAEDG